MNKSVINGRGWRNVLIVCTCMAISVAYEFIEWWVAIGTGESAESFLGTQGYIWDTQSDMFYATIGAIAALMLLNKLHDKQLNTLKNN